MFLFFVWKKKKSTASIGSPYVLRRPGSCIHIYMIQFIYIWVQGRLIIHRSGAWFAAQINWFIKHACMVLHVNVHHQTFEFFPCKLIHVNKLFFGLDVDRHVVTFTCFGTEPKKLPALLRVLGLTDE
jgi:hypothetical protein